MAAGVSEYIERVETDGGEVESDIYVSESVEDLGDFFDDASLVNIPTAYKATKLYSIKPTDGSGDFTFARSTTGTRVNESGLIESVGVNAPRINYSSGVPSLLLEPQRTNLIRYSEIFEGYSSGYWQTFDNGTIETNYGISPQGIQNSTKIGTSGGSNDFVYNSITVSIGTVYTTSCYVKNIDATKSLIYGVHSDNNNLNWSGSQLVSIDNAEFEEVGNGWYRIWITSTAIISSNVFRIYSDRNVSAGSIEVYGFQVEAGAYATSYIPTSGTSVTRTIDAITNSVSYALSSGYTIFIELQTQSLTDSNDIEFKDASSNYVFRVGNEVIIGAGLFTQANTTGYNKFALQVDASGNYELFKNGSSVTSGSGIAHDIEVISSVAGQDVRQMIIFEQALTDAECITLTT